MAQCIALTWQHILRVTSSEDFVASLLGHLPLQINQIFQNQARCPPVPHCNPTDSGKLDNMKTNGIGFYLSCLAWVLVHRGLNIRVKSVINRFTPVPLMATPGMQVWRTCKIMLSCKASSLLVSRSQCRLVRRLIVSPFPSAFRSLQRNMSPCWRCP